MIDRTEYWVSVLPLALWIAVWRLSKGLLAGRLRGLRMPAIMGGRYARFAGSAVWPVIGGAAFVWMVISSCWIYFAASVRS